VDGGGYMVAPVIVTPVEEPTSKASVLWPSDVPAELSIESPETVRVVASLMLIN